MKRIAFGFATVMAGVAAAVSAAPARASVIFEAPVTTSTPIGSTLTDFSGSLVFPQFDASLGQLVTVDLALSDRFVTTLTVTNGGTASHGFDQTNLQLSGSDALSLFPSAILIDRLSPRQSYTLAAGAQQQLPKAAGGGFSNTAYSTSALVSTDGLSDTALVAEFVGNGHYTLDVAAFATTLLGNSGGNTSSSEVTLASVTGSISYGYTPAAELPEPLSAALLGSALVGLGLLRRRFR